MSYIAQDILETMDFGSLVCAQNVSEQWRGIVEAGNLWKKLLDRYVLFLASYKSYNNTNGFNQTI